MKRGSGKQAIATTMAFVRLLKDLMRDPEIGRRIVPIIPDEARTFGMDCLFPTAKIYSPHGQTYTSVDRDLVLAYKEATDGQLLHEGINEAGSVASFTAVGSAYATHGEPMIPIYIFYSMFGFQRTGDGFWAAMDQMARGFVARRHRRPHHAERRGAAARGRALAAARGDEPRRRRLRRRVRLRARPHRQGRPAPDVRRGRRGRLLLPDRLQRAVRPAGRAGRRRRRRHPARHAPVSPAGDGEGLRAQVLASGVAVPWALEAQQLLARGLGRPGRRVVGHLLDRAASRRPRGRPAQPARAHRRAAHGLRARPPRGSSGSRRRGVGLHARAAGPHPPVGARRLRDARHGRLGHVRHPRCAAPALPRRRAEHHRPHARLARRARRDRPREPVAEAIARYQLHDPSAADAGNTEGAG